MKNSIVPATPIRDNSPVQLGASDVAPLDYTPAQPADDEGGGDWHAKVLRFWAATKRFRWLIAAFAIAGTIAGVIATRYIDPVYEARGAIWVSDVGGGGDNSGAYRPPELLPTGSWVQLIRSFAVVDAVVADQRLWVKGKSWQDSVALIGIQPTTRAAVGDYTLSVDSASGKYTLSEKKKGAIERGLLGDSVGRSVGFAWVPTLQSLQGRTTVSFTTQEPRSVSVDLIKRLDVEMQLGSNFITLTLTGPDQFGTAALLNVWMKQFVSKAAELRRQNLEEQAAIMAAQKAAADTSLHGAENSLESFRKGAITKPSDVTVVPAAGATVGETPPQDVLANEFFRSQTTYQNVKQTRQTLEALIPTARQGNFSPDALAALVPVNAAPELSTALKELVDEEAQLRIKRQQYTDSFPAVKQLAASVQQLRSHTVPDLLETQVNILKQAEAKLATTVAQDSAALQGIPARTIEEARLRRNVSTAENLYTNIEGRYEAAQLGAESTVPDVRVLDPALPAASAQRNTKALLVLGGFGGALAFGIALALVLDALDPRFRYPEQIADDLKMEVIGAIPTVPKPTDANKDPEAMLQSVEAFRGLRMNLHHAFDAPPVIVTVTSPGMGDGKSMVSSNLALSFADAGFKTLLIDGDIRRGKLHSIFGLERRPGLLDYLAGDVDAVSVMRDVAVHGSLTLIPSGTRRHRGPELLTSARLPALLNMLRSKFDVIIIDSAPLAAGVDAYALSVASHNMILVMRTGFTNRRMAKAKLRLIERLPVRVLGAVVNAVPASGVYAEYSYLYGYGPDSEADEDPTAIRDEIAVLHSGSESEREI